MYTWMIEKTSAETMKIVIHYPGTMVIPLTYYDPTYFSAAINTSIINHQLLDQWAYMIGYDGVGPQLEIWDNMNIVKKTKNIPAMSDKHD